MKKLFVLPILALIVITSIAAVSADKPACNDHQGSIWTTRNDCGAEQQDANSYLLGETVYINGKNFCDSKTYDWNVTGNPGGSSGDPGAVVATGSHAVNASGDVCFPAYTIATDDWGEYKVDFGNSSDNYRIQKFNAIPEFGAIVGALTLISAIGVFFLVRRK